MTTQQVQEKKAVLLATTKKMNSSLSKGKYKKAFHLLQIGNSIRIELGEKPMILKNLESRFA